MTAADFRAWLDRHELRNVDAAPLLGLHKTTVSRYATGSLPIPETVAAHCRTLDGRDPPDVD
jgi:predicted transcriptional regulator